jgi:hypothetical protein
MTEMIFERSVTIDDIVMEWGETGITETTGTLFVVLLIGH